MPDATEARLHNILKEIDAENPGREIDMEEFIIILSNNPTSTFKMISDGKGEPSASEGLGSAAAREAGRKRVENDAGASGEAKAVAQRGRRSSVSM